MSTPQQASLGALYATGGRPSIPPEQLLKAKVLMALYSVRSERLFCEQLGYNLLWLWFLDRELDEGSFDATVFTHNSRLGQRQGPFHDQFGADGVVVRYQRAKTGALFAACTMGGA